MTEPNPQQIFRLYRDYIEHENTLINHRTTWLITIQSFLMATFGFTYQKRFEVAAALKQKGELLSSLGSLSDEYTLFMAAMAIIGLAVSLLALFSVRAAAAAISELRTKWDSLGVAATAQYLPGITGGGNREATRNGIWLSWAIPAFFVGVWLFTLAFLLLKVSPR